MDTILANGLPLEEEKQGSDYFSHKSYFFVITNAGKPVFTTYLVIISCQI